MVPLYTIHDVTALRHQLPEMKYLADIINNSPDFLADMERKGGLLLEKLLVVKVANFSESKNRTKTTIHPGRLGKFPFLRVNYQDDESPVAYAQIRGIFKTVYCEMHGKSDLVFVIRCVRECPSPMFVNVWGRFVI